MKPVRTANARSRAPEPAPIDPNAGIIEVVTQETGFTKHKTAAAVESVLEIMKDTPASGEDILISGFGKFCVCDKAKRRGRNPATGDDLMLPARRVVTL